MSQHMAVQPHDAVTVNTHNLTLAHHRVPSSSVVEHPTRSQRVVGSNPIWDLDFFRVYVSPRIYIISEFSLFSKIVQATEQSLSHLSVELETRNGPVKIQPCWCSVSRNNKIEIETVQQIMSRIWEKKEGKYLKTLAKIQVTAVFLKGEGCYDLTSPTRTPKCAF